MNTSPLDLDGGTFKLNLPYTWQGWLVWVIGMLITLVGAGLAITSEPSMAFLMILGCLLLALTAPGSLEATLHSIRKEAMPPEALEAKAQESGFTVDSWWLQQTTYVPTTDPSDWILPAPGYATWNKENPYAADEGGEPIAEHPHKVGTPTPATFSLFSIYAFIAVAGTVAAGGTLMRDDPEGVGIVPAAAIAGVGLILTLVGWFRAKMLGQMLDTPTSLVRSAPVGHPELVGQVRPGHQGAMRVVVDGNEKMAMDHMVGYHWEYEQKQCRTVKDSEGNSKEECTWVTVRQEKGGCDFFLHDGTGGIKVNTTTFKRRKYGQYLKRWDGAFAQTLGKQVMAQAMAGLLRGTKVKQHRWTLSGLRLGNPVYIMGQTVPRSTEEWQAEGLDGTIANSIIEVKGDEDGVGMKCVLQRGSELANAGRSRSMMEMLVPPIVMMLGGLALFGLA